MWHETSSGCSLRTDFWSSKNNRYKHARIQWDNSCKVSLTLLGNVLAIRIQSRVTWEMKPQLRNCLDEMGYCLILMANYWQQCSGHQRAPHPRWVIQHCLRMLTEHGPESKPTSGLHHAFNQESLPEGLCWQTQPPLCCCGSVFCHRAQEEKWTTMTNKFQ